MYIVLVYYTSIVNVAIYTYIVWRFQISLSRILKQMFYLYEFRKAIITFHKNSFCISFKECEHKKTDHSCNVSWQATVFRLRIWGYNYIPSEITNCYASSQKLLLILLQMKKEGIIVKLVL